MAAAAGTSAVGAYRRMTGFVGNILFLGGLLTMPYLLHLIGTYAVAVKGGATASAAFGKVAATHLGFFKAGTISEGVSLVGNGVSTLGNGVVAAGTGLAATMS